MKLSYPIVGVIAALVGCTQYLPSVGPDYKAPEFDLKGSDLPDAGAPTTNLTANCEYGAAAEGDDGRKTIARKELETWWLRFNDPVLADLVTSAVSNNVSFRTVQSRLRQANWELLGTYSAFLPKFGIDGSWSHDVLRHNNKSLVDTTAASSRTRTWNLGVGADWEIDIFGGSRRATEAAIAAYQAQEWTVADAWIALACQIGSQYITLRTTQERLDVARTNLILQAETYDILKSRLDSGIGDELAVNQCAYIVEQTRARIPSLLAEEEALKNSIAILAGEMPGVLHSTLEPVAERRHWLLEPQKIAALPLDAMRRRPDVQAAERKLAAQTARIGIAKSQWYPKLFITGSVGLQAPHGDKLFKYDSVMSSFGPSVNWPIFQAGAIYASVKAEEEKTYQALCDYELALEEAYSDVRTAYARYSQEYFRYQSLEGAVKAATDAVTISQDLYKNGLKDFNNVLDAQRSRLTLEESLAVSRGQITLYLIDLYKALGGGLVLE